MDHFDVIMTMVNEIDTVANVIDVLVVIVLVLCKKKQQTIQEDKKYIFFGQEEVKCVVVRAETT